jgi:hypothetical protein
LYRFRREVTAEALRAQSGEFLMTKYSDLCELCVSVVKKLGALVSGSAGLGSPW